MTAGRHDDDPGKVRGQLCASLARWATQEFGPEVLHAQLRTLSVQDQAQLDPSRADLAFLPSAWIPAPFTHRVLEAVFEAAPEAEHQRLAAEAGLAVFSGAMNGLQRALFSLLLTPKRYVKHAHKAWRHNFGSGDLEFEAGEGFHRCVYHDWREHHPIMCTMMTHGKVSVYQAMGKRNAHVTIVRCTGGEGCESIVEWDLAPPEREGSQP